MKAFLHCAFQLRLWIKSCKDCVQLQDCWRGFYRDIRWGWGKKNKFVNHRASNFLGVSGIVAPPAPPAFRNVLSRAARIEKQMHPKPKQTELGVGSEWANAVLASSLPTASTLS